MSAIAPQLVVLDGYTLNPGDNPWSELEALGHLRVYERTKPAEAVERARDATVLLTNKTPIDAELIAHCPNLKAVCVLATGFNVVDVAAAKAQGVAVCNVPAYSTDSVAQHTFALLLELTNQVGLHAQSVADGDWIRSEDFAYWKTPLLELSSKTLGIIGFGSIGRRVADLGRAFGMQIWATSGRSTPPPELAVHKTHDEIFAGADVVSLHCPLTATTEKLVCERTLRLMKPTALLLNTARGGLIDELALRRALEEGWLRAAALDVVSTEPMPQDHPLRALPNCVITPHLSWASQESRQRLMRITVENVRAALAGQPIHVINP